MKLGKSLGALGCALIGATMFAALPALAQKQKPNVVFFLVDNTGWGDFSVYGGPGRFNLAKAPRRAML